MDKTEDLLGNIEKLRQITSTLNENDGVPAVELFPADYISLHTNFRTIQEMLQAGKIKTAEDLFQPEWSAFVAANSHFASWDEMLNDAAIAWINRR